MLGYELNICYTYLYKNNTIFIVGDRSLAQNIELQELTLHFQNSIKSMFLEEQEEELKGVCVCVCYNQNKKALYD